MTDNLLTADELKQKILELEKAILQLEKRMAGLELENSELKKKTTLYQGGFITPRDRV